MVPWRRRTVAVTVVCAEAARRALRPPRRSSSLRTIGRVASARNLAWSGRACGCAGQPAAGAARRIARPSSSKRVKCSFSRGWSGRASTWPSFWKTPSRGDRSKSAAPAKGRGVEWIDWIADAGEHRSRAAHSRRRRRLCRASPSAAPAATAADRCRGHGHPCSRRRPGRLAARKPLGRRTFRPRGRALAPNSQLGRRQLSNYRRWAAAAQPSNSDYPTALAALAAAAELASAPSAKALLRMSPTSAPGSSTRRDVIQEE